MSDLAVIEELVQIAAKNIRVNGELEEFPTGPDDSSLQMTLPKIWDKCLTDLELTGSVDRSATIGGVRVRANISKTSTGLSLGMRLIADDPWPLSRHNVPDVIAGLTRHPSGLVLATGAFGSGKSAIPASLIDDWNARNAGHVLCLEEPTEFVFRPKRARISQREVGTHTSSWAEGIKAARRSDPDIVLVGELRDSEGVQAAIAAAAAGVLVLATLHAGSTVEALTALLAMVGEDRRAMVRTQLGQSLRGIITQQLLPTSSDFRAREVNAPGRVAARELLLGTDTVRAQIMGDDFKRINSTIESSRKIVAGREEGMFLMKHSLIDLVLRGSSPNRPPARTASNPTSCTTTSNGPSPAPKTESKVNVGDAIHRLPLHAPVSGMSL